MKFYRIFLITALVSAANLQGVFAQSVDRFIRIVGNAERTFNYEKLSVAIIVSEIAPNEYRQTRYRSVEQVRGDYAVELEKLGISASSLVADPKFEMGNQYQKTKMERYSLTLKDKGKLSALTDIFIEGVSIKEVKYAYKDPGYEIESELSIEAVNDARRKAERLAKDAGKKLGKILNIEDKSNGCCREIKEANAPTYKMSYKLLVTFELLD